MDVSERIYEFIDADLSPLLIQATIPHGNNNRRVTESGYNQYFYNHNGSISVKGDAHSDQSTENNHKPAAHLGFTSNKGHM